MGLGMHAQRAYIYKYISQNKVHMISHPAEG